MLIQRGILSCKRCEKDGIPADLQWTLPDQMMCLGCGSKLSPSTSSADVPDQVGQIVKTLAHTHLFEFNSVGTKRQHPTPNGPVDAPRIYMTSKNHRNVQALITWNEISKKSREQTAMSWSEFCGKHPDLLVPVGLDATFDWLSHSHRVTWSNLTGQRKEVRFTRCCDQSDELRLWIEVEFCWEVSKYSEQDARTDKRSSEQHRVVEVVANALAHMWFGDLVTMKWWDERWANEKFCANYDRGTATLVAIKSLMGDQTYRNGIKLYLSSSGSYSNAEAADMWKSLFVAWAERQVAQPDSNYTQNVAAALQLLEAFGLPQAAVSELKATAAGAEIDQKRFDQEVRALVLVCVEKLAQAEKDKGDVVSTSIGSDIRDLAGAVGGEQLVVAERVARLFTAIGYDVSESMYGDEVIFSNLQKRRQLLAK